MKKKQTIEELKEAANKQYQRIKIHSHDMLNLCIESGAILAQIKRKVGHGNWYNWLEENYDGGKSTAGSHMRLYKHRRKIEDRLGVGSNISVTKALQLISSKTDDIKFNALIDDINKGISQEFGPTTIKLPQRDFEKMKQKVGNLVKTHLSQDWEKRELEMFLQSGMLEVYSDYLEVIRKRMLDLYPIVERMRNAEDDEEIADDLLQVISKLKRKRKFTKSEKKFLKVVYSESKYRSLSNRSSTIPNRDKNNDHPKATINCVLN